MAYEDQENYYTTKSDKAIITRTTVGRAGQKTTYIYFTRVRKRDGRVVVYNTGRTDKEGLNGFDFDAATAKDSGNKLGYIDFTKNGDKNFVVTKDTDGKNNITSDEKKFFSSTKGIKEIKKSTKDNNTSFVGTHEVLREIGLKDLSNTFMKISQLPRNDIKSIR